MRIISIVVLSILFLSSRAADAQTFGLYGSAGPTLTDAGNSFAFGGGFSPNSRLSLLFGYERTHLSSTKTSDGRTFSQFRGGTLHLATAELRVTPFGRRRIGPYAVAGLAFGQSRPNVNEFFPDPVVNSAGALILGGGVQVPINEQLTAFADVRAMVGAEGNDGVVGVAPLRGGLAWRF